MKKWLSLPQLPDWFSFSKKERIGLLVLLILLIILKGISLSYHPTHQWISSADSAWIQAARALSVEVGDSSKEWKQSPDNFADIRHGEKQPRQLFEFDPNQIGLAQWQMLGLTEKTATGILHYRSKGGRFKKPEDLKKIWGISPQLAAQLMPYVYIQLADTFPKWPERKPFPKTNWVVEINTADSAAWERLPGIGPSLAKRIVRFKERLGGFYKIEQVAETFGLPDSTYQRIRPYLQFAKTSVQQIDLNQADQAALQQHPYIRYALAKIIVNYRQQHGPFASVDALKQIHLMNDSIFQLLRPYLQVR